MKKYRIKRPTLAEWERWLMNFKRPAPGGRAAQLARYTVQERIYLFFWRDLVKGQTAAEAHDMVRALEAADSRRGRPRKRILK